MLSLKKAIRPSVTLYIFLKRTTFPNLKLLGKKKIQKIRRSVSLQNKPRTNPFSICSTITLGNGYWDLEMRASSQITSQHLQILSTSRSLVLMQIFNYLILNSGSAKKAKQSSASAVGGHPKVHFVQQSSYKGFTQYVKECTGFFLYAYKLSVVKSWSSGDKQVNWETQ